MRKKIPFFLALLCLYGMAFAQKDTTLTDDAGLSTDLQKLDMTMNMSLPGPGSSNNMLPFSLPPSPEAQAFKKFGDFPVSHYTGLPDISIPFYTIKLQGLSIPIQLAYHASGIKVDQVASWVGLGWNLQSGGVISRNIQGIADDESGGILDPTRSDNYYPSSFESVNTIETYPSNGTELPFLSAVQSNEKDSESDIYSLNAFGMNVKFIIDSDANVFCFPKSNLKITPISTTNLGWIVTDTNGNKFYFEETESNSSMTRETNGGSPSTINLSSPVTGWYITKIVTPTGEQILFDYQMNGSTQSISINETATFIPHGVSDPNHPDDKDSHSYSEYDISYSVPVLNKITFPTGELRFILSTSLRSDINGTAYPLDKVEIRNKSGALQKYFDFNYGYFQGRNLLGQTQQDYLHLRLKLLSLTEKGSDGSSLPPYEFTYYTGHNLPGIYSVDRDHWGYYNGDNDNHTNEFKLIPHKTYLSQFISGLENTYSGAERDPSYPAMKAWTLTKIKYPTKGETEFQYEAHTYYKSGNKTAGGLRIKRIVNYNTDGSLPTFKEYSYLKPSSSSSSGKFTHSFKYAYKINSPESSPCPSPQYGCPSGVNTSGCGHAIPLQSVGELYYSSSRNGLGLTKGSSVGYEYVTEKSGYKSGASYYSYTGESRYRFTTKSSSSYIEDEPVSGCIGFMSLCYPHYKTTGSQSIDYYFPVFSFPSKDWREGLILEKIVYNETGSILSSITNSYTHGLNSAEIGQGLRITELPMYFEAKTKVPNIFYSKYSVHTDWTRLDKTVEKTYDGSAELTKTTNYTYNSTYYLVTESSFTDSKNSTIKTKYYYPFNYSTSSYNIGTLKSKNIIGKPIDVRTYDGSQLRSGTQTKYNADGQPTDIYVAEPTGSDVSFSSTSPYKFSHKASYSYSYDVVTQVTPDDNYNTVYLWDATGNYIMAKIENASFSQVSSLNRKSYSYSSKSLYNSLNAALPDDVLITTYTHNPLVGISQQTNTTGVTTYYYYDSFGRLSSIKNDDGKLLKKFDYHYAN